MLLGGKQTYAVGEGNGGLMRLLSDAFPCLLCSSLSLACCLAYKPQGNRLSQSKFLQCLADHGSLTLQSICFRDDSSIVGFAFCAAFPS